MIQRLQTVYLLIGGLALAALMFFDILWEGSAASLYAWFTPAVIGGALICSLMALGSIFMYGNRPNQLKLVRWTKYLTLLVMVALFGGFFLADELMVADEQMILWGRLLPLLLPVIAYIAIFMAQRQIKADIELVRSMDRLR